MNTTYIIDDEKQRSKMTEEFYAAVKKEIVAHQERCDYLIQSGSQSPSVMDRWVLKVRGLEEKKKHYEQVLQRELDGLDDEFNTLKFLAQELQVGRIAFDFKRQHRQYYCAINNTDFNHLGSVPISCYSYFHPL